jgi:hypothetical protein
MFGKRDQNREEFEQEHSSNMMSKIKNLLVLMLLEWKIYYQSYDDNCTSNLVNLKSQNCNKNFQVLENHLLNSSYLILDCLHKIRFMKYYPKIGIYPHLNILFADSVIQIKLDQV